MAPAAQGGASAPAPAAAPASTEGGERSPPVLQTAVAVLSTILVLLIVCMPSRKG
jgi:hypothetical protein